MFPPLNLAPTTDVLTDCFHVVVKIVAGNHLPCSNKFLDHFAILENFFLFILNNKVCSDSGFSTLPVWEQCGRFKGTVLFFSNAIGANHSLQRHITNCWNPSSCEFFPFHPLILIRDIVVAIVLYSKLHVYLSKLIFKHGNFIQNKQYFSLLQFNIKCFSGSRDVTLYGGPNRPKMTYLFSAWLWAVIL